MRKHNFAFIDIEATGLNLHEHEIIEIGCVLTTPELEVVEEFDVKIKPENIENADPAALKVNKYSEEEWKNAVSLREGMKTLAEKVKGCIMVGHNVAFDAGFIEHSFNKVGIQNTMHYHRLDTISIAWAKMHRDPDMERFSLRELCLKFDIQNEKAHTALSDARATYELYKKLMSI
jgi:DNA polymerase III epsilon subunit family exonuclease